MFDNIGKKIKTLAKVICGIGIVASIIVAIIMFIISSMSYLQSVLFGWLGIIILLLGPLFSWIGCFLLYGFGELIDNSAIIAQQSNSSNQNYNKKLEKQHKKDTEQRLDSIKEQLLDNSISEDDYIDIQCPNCDAELSFARYDLLHNQSLTCPCCDKKFNTNIFKKQ